MIPFVPSVSTLRRRILPLVAGISTLLLCGLAHAQSTDPITPPPPAGTDTAATTTPSPVLTRRFGKGKEPKESKKEKAAKLTKEQRKRLEFESGGRTAVEWYKQAVALYKSGHYLDARSILLPLEDSARALDIQEQVKLLIADTYFAQGGALNLAEALARYKSFETFFPSSPHAEYVQFQIGRSYFKQVGPENRDQSFTDNVIVEYEKFLDVYPKSQYAEQANSELMQARVLRARHELAVAEYYWTWKDYRGSATRLETLLADWPELPEREKALWMAAQSMYNMGARQQGDAYAARLAADYPGSSYITKLDAGAAGGRTIDAQLKRRHQEEKEASRTHRRQIAQDMKRTRQIRKDSGLPAAVPGLHETANAPPAAIAAPPAEGAAPAAAAAADAPAPAPAAGIALSAKESEAAQHDKEKAAKLEADEQAAIAKAAESDRKRQEKQQAEQEKAAAKAAEKAAKQAEEDAKKSPQTSAKEAEEAAKAAEARKKEVEKLEAEEARQAAAKAEEQKRKDEKAAAEAAKKAKKKAKKS